MKFAAQREKEIPLISGGSRKMKKPDPENNP